MTVTIDEIVLMEKLTTYLQTTRSITRGKMRKMDIIQDANEDSINDVKYVHEFPKRSGCQYLDSDVDNYVHREGGVGRRGRGDQGGGGFLQRFHCIELTHVLLLGSYSWMRNTNTPN